MAAYLAILNKVAQLVGGTAPDPINSPYFFSGSQVGDNTGIAGIAGCYSIPPETLPDPPIGIVIPENFTLQGPAHSGQLMQGNEDNEDHIRIWVLLWRNDAPTQYANLIPFRDGVPALFRAHMQLGGLVNIDAFIVAGHSAVMKWNGTEYLGWEFILRVRQLLSVTYTDS